MGCGAMSREIRVEDNGKVHDMMERIQLARKKLERSSFYAEFMDQMRDPEMVARIQRVIGTEPHLSQLQVVVYGLGNIDSDGKTVSARIKRVISPEPHLSQLQVVGNIDSVEHNHMQLAFAILFRERFQLVTDIVVSDPVLSLMEGRVINALDCTFLYLNEDCSLTVDRPTLFFMPFCPFPLFPRVLEANWTPAHLSKIIILGNSFKRHKEEIAYDVYRSMRVILNRERVLHEIPLPQTAVDPDPDPVYKKAFNSLSWHFFAVSSDDLQA